MDLFDRLVAANCYGTGRRQRLAAAALETLYGCEINCAEIDKSVQFAHHARGATIIAAKICADVVIYQNVTIGTNLRFNKKTSEWENLGNPVIGKGVIVADGAKILGPVIVGDRSIVAAGAIITRDVPPDTLAYGVNKHRAKEPEVDLLFHRPMVDRDSLIAANAELINKYEQSAQADDKLLN